MGRTVGNIVISLLCMMSMPIFAAISLQVTDMQGISLAEAQVGEPFLMVVSISDIDQDIQEPDINGMQDLYVKRISSRVMMINGDRSMQNTYQVRIDKPGTYQLGPAINPTNQERSQVARVKVLAGEHKAKRETTATKGTQTEPVLLRLWAEKERFYVGQKIKTVLRFYAPEEEQLSIEQVTAEDPTTISVTEKVGPKKGLQDIEGKRYVYYEWQWDMFAKESGQLIIPAYFLDYAKHLPMDQYLSGWASFFGPRYERKRVYSNALTLQVLPLPETDQFVHAVGNFTHYRALLTPAIAKQYEGMVLKLSIEGSGNMQDMQPPDLVVPDSFKWYASKHYIEDLPHGQRKTFEYIVQGLKPGDWEIPEQQFLFFDVDAGRYKQLKTSSLFVTISAGSTYSFSSTQLQTAPVCEKSKTCDALQPLAIDQHAADAKSPIALIWFTILLIIPILLLIGYNISTLFDTYVVYVVPSYALYRLSAHTKKQLTAAQQEGNTQAIDHILKEFFEKRFNYVTTGDMINRLESSSLSSEQKQQAIAFLHKIAEIAYAGGRSKKNDALFKQAFQWLSVFERLS